MGLKTHTTRGEILKSIMESVTLYFVEPLESLRSLGIDTSQFMATGGGARSDAWLQIKADVLGVPFARPAVTECGMVGAAICAGLATRVYSSAAEGVEQFVRTDRVFEPDARRHDIYRAKHELYRQLYPSLKGLL